MREADYQKASAALDGLVAAVSKAIAELDLIEARERLSAIGSGSGE